MRLGLPTLFETLSMTLAIVGVWQVAYAIVVFLPLETGPGKLASVISILAVAATIWIRLAHYPQNVFSTASRSEKRAERLRRDLRTGMACDAAYASLFSVYADTVHHIRTASV